MLLVVVCGEFYELDGSISSIPLSNDSVRPLKENVVVIHVKDYLKMTQK